jgi:hypothetical protein
VISETEPQLRADVPDAMLLWGSHSAGVCPHTPQNNNNNMIIKIIIEKSQRFLLDLNKQSKMHLGLDLAK